MSADEAMMMDALAAMHYMLGLLEGMQGKCPSLDWPLECMDQLAQRLKGGQ